MKNASLILLLMIAFAGRSQDLVVNTFDDYTHEAAGTYNETFTFPADNSMYDRIVMKIALTCPTGGCDPWDRFASLRVLRYGETFEIGRYITPYGNNWCDWELDVTEYREFLRGEVDFESFIETWANGWDLTVDFEFYLGTPDYQHIDVENLWVDYDFTYGDTLFFSNDLPVRNVTVPANAEKTILRIVNTGHGQGNTDNAAEFSQKTHDIVINGSTEFNQFLWNSTCSSNPCSPQAGTWVYNRAGWCPGAQVDPTDYDITSLVTAGDVVSLDYVLEPFFNECSPWNPDCTSGTTCTNCLYDGNGHTKPNYKMSVQLISYSSTPIVILEVEENQFEGMVKLYPNPTNGNGMQLFIQTDDSENVSMEISAANGQVVLREQVGAVLGSVYHPIDTQALENGIYFVKVNMDGHVITKRFIVNN